jgi:hypothetical protein
MLVPLGFQNFHLLAKLLMQEFGDLELEIFHLGN